jgi:hypothetical protein
LGTWAVLRPHGVPTPRQHCGCTALQEGSACLASGFSPGSPSPLLCCVQGVTCHWRAKLCQSEKTKFIEKSMTPGGMCLLLHMAAREAIVQVLGAQAAALHRGAPTCTCPASCTPRLSLHRCWHPWQWAVLLSFGNQLQCHFLRQVLLIPLAKAPSHH